MPEDIEPRPPENTQPNVPENAEPVTPGDAEPVCANCGVPKAEGGSHCPQCGAGYKPAPRVTPIPSLTFDKGCLSVFGGLIAGLIASVVVILLLMTLANSMSNTVFSTLVVVTDLLSLALAIRVIWGANRGLTPVSLFLICLTFTLAGMLSTCSLIVFNMGGSNFH